MLNIYTYMMKKLFLSRYRMRDYIYIYMLNIEIRDITFPFVLKYQRNLDCIEF